MEKEDVGDTIQRALTLAGAPAAKHSDAIRVEYNKGFPAAPVLTYDDETITVVTLPLDNKAEESVGDEILEALRNISLADDPPTTIILSKSPIPPAAFHNAIVGYRLSINPDLSTDSIGYLVGVCCHALSNAFVGDMGTLSYAWKQTNGHLAVYLAHETRGKLLHVKNE